MSQLDIVQQMLMATIHEAMEKVKLMQPFFSQWEIKGVKFTICVAFNDYQNKVQQGFQNYESDFNISLFENSLAKPGSVEEWGNKSSSIMPY